LLLKKPKEPKKGDTPKEAAKPAPPSQPVEDKAPPKSEPIDTTTKSTDTVVVDTPPKKDELPVVVETVSPPAKEDTKPSSPEPVVEEKEVVPPKEEKPQVVEDKEEKKVEKKEEKKTSEDKSTKKSDKKKSTPKSDKGESDQVSDTVEKVKTMLLEFSQTALAFVQSLFTNSDKNTQLVLDNANKIVDKYFDAGSAEWIKTNLFNVYGVVVAAFVFIFSAFLVTRIQWLFTLYTLRAFLSTLGLGVFLTLFVIASLTKDPSIAIAKNNPEIFDNLKGLGLTWFSVLFLLNFLALFRGSVGNFLQLVVSHLLLVDFFGFSHHVEEFTGPLSAYSLLVVTFSLLTLLSFGKLVPSTKDRKEREKEKEKVVSVKAPRSSTPTNKDSSKHKKQKSQG